MKREHRTSFALAQQYADAREAGEEDVVEDLEAALNRRDAELAQLRAELARLKPLAEAAVELYEAHIELGAEYMDEKPDETTLRIRRSECEASELAIRKAAFAYARAQAQAGEGA